MAIDERDPRPEDEQKPPPEPPNEGSAGHHPDKDDLPTEDDEAEQSFPASDPPANY
jgi:hypothetical protein